MTYPDPDGKRKSAGEDPLDAWNNAYFAARAGGADNTEACAQADQAATWETACPTMEDGKHCVHWYDGGPCCSCGDAAAPEGAVE